jgi:hypothetical protein
MDGTQQLLDGLLLRYPSGDPGTERLHRVRGLGHRSQQDHPDRRRDSGADVSHLGEDVARRGQLAVDQGDIDMAAFEQPAPGRRRLHDGDQPQVGLDGKP